MHKCGAFLAPGVPVRRRARKPVPKGEEGDGLPAQLLRRRRELGLRQKEAADLIGVSEFTLGNWESGDNQPMIQHWPAIIDYLGYEPWPAPQTLQEKLKAERRRRGLSIKAAAKVVGIDEATFWWWENGRQPKAQALNTMECFFGCGPRERPRLH